MQQRKIFFLVLLLLTLFPVTVVAESRAAPVDVTVTATGATLNMHLLLMENLTSLPKISLYLGSTNSTTIAGPIAKGIQKLLPDARVTSIELHAKTLNATGRWVLQENYTIQISGSNGGTGSFVRSDLSYLSMNVNDSINIAGAELNIVGAEYLLAPLNAQDPSQTRYFIDNTETLNTVIPALTTKVFALLDFSWVPQVAAWDRQNDVLKQTTKWTITPSSPRYNLTLGKRSPEGILRGALVAVYDPSLELTVSHNAWAQGTQIVFSLPNPFDVWMPGIIAIPIVVWAVSFTLERNFTGRAPSKRKKR
ncbi:hypothetical protein E6H27_01565 [Candidatus Bathyarchaeota archaeon]|nr:MAG: hypothetical protein E6H27_01565 [Candidatus Bathyarchaeota archaeon]